MTTVGRLVVVLALALGVAALEPWPAAGQTLTTYDRFDAPMLDPARWRGYELTVAFTDYSGGTAYNNSIRDHEGVGGPSGVENAETRREITGGQARLALTTVSSGTYLDSDHRQGRGRLGLRVSDVALADHAPLVRAMQARVTIVAAEHETACTYIYRAREASAGIYGTFFNDGSSTGPADRTGDITAFVIVGAQPGSDQTSVTAGVWRCSDPACAWIKALPTTGDAFTVTGLVGQPHLLTLRWQPDRSRFVMSAKIGSAPAVQRPRSYDPAIAPSAPVGYAYDLRIDVAPGGCTGPAPERDRVGLAVDARFDNVRLDSDAVAADAN